MNEVPSDIDVAHLRAGLEQMPPPAVAVIASVRICRED